MSTPSNSSLTPLAAAAPGGPEPDEAGSHGVVAGELFRVLVVDDDQALLRTVRRMGRAVRDEVELELVDNGFDALVRVGERTLDLVVMDVFMPGLNGVEACRRLKANPSTRDLRVILTSAAVTAELEVAARDAGADAVISKPYDVADLVPRKRRRLAQGTEGAPLADGSAPSILPPPPTAALPTPAPQPAAMRRAADVLVDELVAAGVEVVFGLPGGAISPVHDALLDRDINVITVRHESGAMFAAAGYARATGKIGVALVTSGPGALNSITGVASAWCDGLPVLLLTGEVARKNQGRGVLQDGSAYGLQVVEMMKPVVKLAAEVPEARQLPHLLRRAITTALSGRRGPVVLSLPVDVMTTPIAPPVMAGEVKLTSAVPDYIFDEVIATLASAQRPLLLLGSGVLGGAAPALARALAERTGCPVATTPKGKGVFPEGSPLSLGVLGLGGHPSAQAYLAAGVDVLIAVGTSLGDLSTDGFSPHLQADRAMIHVDIDARQIGKSYSPTLALVTSAEGFFAGLLRRVPADLVARPARGELRRHELPLSTHAVAPHQFLRDLQTVLPADTLYTADSGDHFLFATHYLQLEHPDAFIVMSGLGSMGQSIGAAIGAQLAHPGRRVAAIVGDGCFAMNAFEVATAVQAGLPIRVFVYNDGALGMVENGHEAVYGRRPSYSTRPLDVVEVARGLGAAVVRVDRDGEILQHAALLRDHPGPVVVDVRIDGGIRLPKKDRMAAFTRKRETSGGVN
jgi:acetolactate synthase-1/2/3 large subunit